MQLTDEQYAAAKACGFAFFPATEAQVQRLSMQRRIFWVDAKPFMVTCNGAYYETQGTLLPQIEAYLHRNLTCAGEVQVPSKPSGPEPDHAVALKDAPEQVASLAAPAQTQCASAIEAEPSAARAGPRGRHLPPAAETLPQDERSAVAAALVPSPVQHELQGVEDRTNTDDAVSDNEAPPPARGRLRPRRLGQPKTPRWVTAGKARRGRLK